MRIRYALTALVFVMLASTGMQAWGGVALQSFVVVSSAPGTHVFSSIGQMSAPGPESGPGAAVAWPVTIDLALLNTLPATLQLNFPDRSSITLTRIRSEKRGGSALMWMGRSDDCGALFDVFADGSFKSTISCLDAQYGVDHPSGSANLRLSRYDNAGMGTNEEPSPGFHTELPPRGTSTTCPAGISDTTVDILVLFNGSMTTTPIWNVAQYAVDQTQMAMVQSTSPGQPTIAQLKLAGAARIARTVNNDPVGDLRDLPTDTDLKALRKYWAADAVVYITTGTGPVEGIANVPSYEGQPPPGPGFAPAAIAVTLAAYATNPGDYVFAHEFAHTFGANHNRDHGVPNPTPVEPWAFGHWAVEHELGIGARSIMSYVQECTGHPCERILHYSNPDVYVDGWFRTGLNNANNALLIKDIAPVEAQYCASVGRIFANGFE